GHVEERSAGMPAMRGPGARERVALHHDAHLAPLGDAVDPAHVRRSSARRRALADVELTVDGDIERNRRQHDAPRDLERALVLELTLGQRLAHRLFDLALRRDAHGLEEFAQAHVEIVFVHRSLLAWPYHRRGVLRAPSLRRSDAPSLAT